MTFDVRMFGVACLLGLLLAGSPAYAGWELYDDFSSGSIDLSKWENVGDSQVGVTWSVVDGKLRVTKSAGATDAESAQYLTDLPNGANGLKADVTLVSNSGVMRMQLEFRVDAAPQTFGTDTAHDSQARFRNQFGTYTWNNGSSYGLYNSAHYIVRAVDDDALEDEFGRTQIFLNDNSELTDTHTVSIQLRKPRGTLRPQGSGPLSCRSGATVAR